MLKKYQCHKKVIARPMLYGVYREYRNWPMICDSKGHMIDDPDEEGYLTIYKKDTPEHKERWIPKKEFEDNYSEEE